MLKHLTYHYQFKHHLKLFRDSLSFSDKKRLRAPTFKLALFKVLHLDLDRIHPLLSQLYSPVGRPAIHQIEIFRSLFLMNHFGYTSYFLACHTVKENTALDLPLHFQLVPSSQHDAITIFGVLAQFRHLNPGISVQHLCLDSAHDNSSTFQLCHDWQINPVIDLNKRNTKEKKFNDEFTLDLDGTPLCRCKERMVNWGYCKDRYRYKYRCPLKCGKTQDCPYKDSCSQSEYGRVLYIKSEELDPRYRSSIKYKTEEWNEIYKNRTSCERVNNRILNDYHLQHTFMRTKRRLYLLEMLCCINIHADAWYKFSDFDI